MKIIILILIFCGMVLVTKAQDVSVEKSTYGIQTGFLGFWVHKESKLTNSIALRGEMGFDSGVSISSDGSLFLLTPVFTIEPRWYYNLNKRVQKSRSIEGNSGNFLSIKTSYNPDWFVISNADNVRVTNQVSIVPTWGIRRNVGNHFTYETGIGLGYRYYFEEGIDNAGEIALNLHLRIGYRF